MKKLTEYATAHAAMIDLCDVVYDRAAELKQAILLDAADLPAPYEALLAHNEHMTVQLQQHLGTNVELHVQREVHEKDRYHRRIVLTRADSGAIVEFGVVRIDLDYMQPSVREEILAKRTPLGEILICHGVLRRIVPHWYMRFDAGSAVTQEFVGSDDGPAFGRVGTILCNEQPAIELLEIVKCP
ncbi:MAG: hypothetical protein IID37_11495 [Planctomycetes bacterium]|nr:hypothetical protein [Planctomycetota bacterium]